MEANPQPVSVLAPQPGNSERRSKMKEPAPKIAVICGTVSEITTSVPSHMTINANTMAAMP